MGSTFIPRIVRRAVNAPVSFAISASYSTPVRGYDAHFDTSINNCIADFRNAATPIFDILEDIDLTSVHWVIRVQDVGYSTPVSQWHGNSNATPLFSPLSDPDKVVVNGTAGPIDLDLGRQSWVNAVEADFATAIELATPSTPLPAGSVPQVQYGNIYRDASTPALPYSQTIRPY